MKGRNVIDIIERFQTHHALQEEREMKNFHAPTKGAVAEQPSLLQLTNNSTALKEGVKIMKTKFYWLALFASAVLIAPAQAGGRQQGGGGGFVAPHVGGGAHSAGPGFYSGPRGNFGGGRFMSPGMRFSPYRSPMAFRQQRFSGSDGAFARSRQFATGTANRRLDGPRTFDRQESRLTRNGNSSGNRFENRSSNAAREHVFARRSADWHRDWDRRHDHWWHGHRCRFVNGEWFIFDSGFEPWWPYWYPYDYYPYSYSYDDYNSGADQGGEYYGQSGNADQYTDSTVANAQEQLAQQGYYRGAIDGVFGPETRRAIVRYQSAHGLRVTGNLNADTLHALGLPTVASN